MRYPKLLSRIGYYEKLLEQYSKDFPDLPKKSVLEGSISIILRAISNLIEENLQDDNLEKFNRAIGYISNVAQLTEEEYHIAFKEIKPDQSVAVLYLGINKPKVVASVIQNNMAFTVEPENMERYFEFLGKVVRQSCNELAEVNKPKLNVKTVRFNEDLVTQYKNAKVELATVVETSTEPVGKKNQAEVNGIQTDVRETTKSSTNKMK